LPDNIKKAMKPHFVEQMDEVLTLALESPLIALVQDESGVLTSVPPPDITASLPAPQ
jgi:ATP-dependent Lon protease